MIRVVVLLAGGQYASTYFPTEAEASNFIREWAEGAEKNLGKQTHELESKVLRWTDQYGQLAAAFATPYIISMYIPNDQPTAQDRAAAAMEAMAKQATDGEDWKNS